MQRDKVGVLETLKYFYRCFIIFFSNGISNTLKQNFNSRQYGWMMHIQYDSKCVKQRSHCKPYRSIQNFSQIRFIYVAVHIIFSNVANFRIQSDPM